MSRRTPAVVVAVLVLSAGAVSALPASAGEPPPSTKYYPSTCGTATLQLCVGGAIPGDVIKIDTDEPIEEFVVVNRTLTLEAADGYHPTIVGGVRATADVSTIVVTFRGLTIAGQADATFTGGTAHTVLFEDLAVTAPTNTVPISVYTTVPATITMRSNRALEYNDGGPGLQVFAAHDAGTVTASIVGNRATSSDPTSGSGIDARLDGDGDLHAMIHNNAIWRAGRVDFSSRPGIMVKANGAGTADFDVVGNTVDRVRDDGLRLENTLTSPGHVWLDLFDNLFAHTEGAGVAIQSGVASTRTIRAGSNAFADNGAPNDWDGAASGTVLHVANAGFVDEPAGDLRLKATSSLVDAGIVCTAGGLENLDANRNGRLAGSTVDVGAYERGAVAPTGEAQVGTSGGEELIGGPGADILCGLGGGDALFGGKGRDFVDGGPGPDAVLNGQAGPDRVLGGTGDDVCLEAIDGVTGNDRLDGGPGIDGAEGDPGDVLLRTEHLPVTCTD